MIDIDSLIEEEEEITKQTPPNDDPPSPPIIDDDSTDMDDDDDSNPNPDDNNDSDDNDTDEIDEDAQAYFEFLKSEQVLDLPDDFKFKGNSESIQEALALTRKNVQIKTVNQIWNSLPEDFKPILEYALNGGKSVQEFLKATETTDAEDLNLDDDISRKAVIKTYYKILNPNLDDAQISKRIDKLEQISDLEEEAKDAVEYLKTYKEEKKNALLLEARARQEQELVAAKKQIDTYVALIDEAKDFDSNRKNRLKQFLLSPNQDNTTGFESALDAIYENPAHKVELANILADYDPKIGFNFDRLQKKLQTKVTKNFKDLINSKDTKSQIRGVQKPSKEDFNWDEFFE